METTNILGIPVSAIDLPIALETIQDWIERRENQYVIAANTHVLAEGHNSHHYLNVLKYAGMVTPDGMPLVWASRLMGHHHVSRVYGPDLLLAACERSLQTGWRHYFYGGGEGVAEALAANLSQRFPGLIIAGLDTPPFRPLTVEEDTAAIAKINAAGTDIVWVGLGAPKQEYWMADHLGKVNAPVMIGVGAAFDFHSGVKKQAPLWMQRSGLEWLFRLASEPRRLWKRYLINNSLFLWLFTLQVLGIKRFPIDKS